MEIDHSRTKQAELLSTIKQKLILCDDMSELDIIMMNLVVRLPNYYCGKSKRKILKDTFTVLKQMMADI